MVKTPGDNGKDIDQADCREPQPVKPMVAVLSGISSLLHHPNFLSEFWQLAPVLHTACIVEFMVSY